MWQVLYLLKFGLFLGKKLYYWMYLAFKLFPVLLFLNEQLNQKIFNIPNLIWADIYSSDVYKFSVINHDHMLEP